MKMEIYPLVLLLALPVALLASIKETKLKVEMEWLSTQEPLGKMPAPIPEMFMTMSHIILTFLSSALKH